MVCSERTDEGSEGVLRGRGGLSRCSEETAVLELPYILPPCESESVRS